jgi:hypothetical protein
MFFAILSGIRLFSPFSMKHQASVASVETALLILEAIFKDKSV